MRSRTQLWTSAALLLVVATVPLVAQELPVATPEAVGMSSDRLDRLTAAIERYVEEGRLAGAVTTVLRDGKVVCTEAVGARDRESESPMTTDAIFRIASQSKALISVGIMTLQEEGELLINDRVSEYLPAFRNTTVAVRKEGGGYEVVDARRPITLRDLLTHTAGIGYGSGPGPDRWQDAEITGWYFGHRNEPIQIHWPQNHLEAAAGPSRSTH